MMANLVVGLMVDRVDLVDEGANSAAFIRLYKRKETEQKMPMTFDEILAKMLPEHVEVIKSELEKAKSEVPSDVQEELQKAKDDLKAKEEALQELAKRKDDEGDDEPDMEEVMKSLDPTVQKYFNQLKAQKEAAEAMAKSAAEKQLHEEAVAKAKELKALPVAEDKLVEVVKSASPEVLNVLKAASNFIEESGLLDEVGKSRGNDGGADAWTRIEKRASEIMTAEGITKEAAISRVIKQHPDLYREYLNGGTE